MKHANIFSPEEMNIFYNAADVLAFPTRGEGFGLPSLEAMATKTPVIATRFGPQIEIHDNDRGYFIDVADYDPGMAGAYTMYARPSRISLLRQLNRAYSDKRGRERIAETAYAWAIQHTWKSKAEQMDAIIEGTLNASVIQKPDIGQSIPANA